MSRPRKLNGAGVVLLFGLGLIVVLLTVAGCHPLLAIVALAGAHVFGSV